MITGKLLFDGEEMKLFDRERFKSIKGDFSGCWIGFFRVPRVTHKGSGKGETVHTWWVEQFWDIFHKKEDAWHMFLVYNPAGHGFVLKDLV